MGKVGVEPTVYQSHGFTVRCNRHYAHLPIYRHSYSGDDYYFIYRHIKHIRKYYQVVDGGNSVSTHPLEYSLRSIETYVC